MEVKILVEGTEKEYVLSNCSAPVDFSAVLQELGIVFSKPCGGSLRCLRCGVRFVYGAPAITDADTQAFERTELKNGWRLGCKLVLTKDCKIEIPQALVSEITSGKKHKKFSIIHKKAPVGVVVDIGTTTLIFGVVDMNTGKFLQTASITNPLIFYGADVMTRIDNAMKGNADAMAFSLQNVILGKIREMLEFVEVKTKSEIPVVLSGNTTMIHLLQNYPVSGLAAFPFAPYSLEPSNQHEDEFLLQFMPAVSAFIGGDIISGLYLLKDQFMTGNNIFIDLGTNAEMVVYNGKEFHAASAACGPALEAGNLKCGIASVKGAINHLRIENGRCIYETIDDAPAIGICGSGVIDLVAQLKENEIIDEGGLLQGEYADKDFVITDKVSISGEDISQVILAKSAIRSTLTLLLKEADISEHKINHVFIAGGLGESSNVSSLVSLGILPRIFETKVISCGNTSLLGAKKLLLGSDKREILGITQKVIVHELANNPDFEKEFLQNLCI